jgi:hypothetical protein
LSDGLDSNGNPIKIRGNSFNTTRRNLSQRINGLNQEALNQLSFIAAIDTGTTGSAFEVNNVGGTLLTTPVTGAKEYDGNCYYNTLNSNGVQHRRQLQQLKREAILKYM